MEDARATPPNLGDSWAFEPQPESSSPVSLDYFRSKAREFQVTLNALDASYRAAVDALSIPSLSPSLYDELAALVREYDGKRLWIKGVAESMNLAAAAINALGGRAPVLSIPSTLGLPPLVVPAVYAGTVVAAIAVLEWSSGFVSRAFATINSIADLQALPEPDRAAVVTARDRARDALMTVQGSGLGALASVGKWVLIAGIAFFAWRALQKAR